MGSQKSLEFILREPLMSLGNFLPANSIAEMFHCDPAAVTKT